MNPEIESAAGRVAGGLPSCKHAGKNWAFFVVMAFWSALLLVNLMDFAPSVTFRGVRFVGIDFDQYYAAGVAAADGLWTEMYPESSKFVKGRRPAEAPYKPGLSEDLSRRGAAVRTKNIYPPPTALLFRPLAAWNFTVAQRLFVAFLFLCVAAFLWLLFDECLFWGIPARAANIVVLLAGTGLPMTESVMLANMTPAIGLCGLLVVRGVRNGKPLPTVLGFAVAGLTKGFSAVWIPALFIRRRWKTVAVGALAGLAVLAAAVAAGAGPDVWREYVSEVLPASRGNLYRIGDSNLAVPSFLAWTFGWSEVPARLSRLLSCVQLALVVSGFAMAWRIGERRSGDADAAVAVSLLLATTVFQSFSTVCWPHYSVNILPFVPAAAAICRNRRFAFGTVLFGFALTWFPIGNALKYLTGGYIFGFGRFFGYMIVVCWAECELIRLVAKRGEAGENTGSAA